MKHPTTGRAFTAAEHHIINQGFPPFLILSAEERKAAWASRPITTIPAWVDPRIEAEKVMRAQMKIDATKQRIARLRESKGLIADNGSATSKTQTQEGEVPKYVIKPLDKQGHPVMRAMTSINDDADQDAIDAKVIAAVERGGSKVVAVTLTNTLGEVTLAWSVDEKGEVGPTDVGPYKTVLQEVGHPEQIDDPALPAIDPESADADAAPAEATVATEVESEKESDMAKKVKAKKTPKAKKAAGNGGLRAGSKQEMLYNMLTRKSGCTTDEAVKATGWKSCGLTVWGKKFGLKVTKEKSASGITRYYGA